LFKNFALVLIFSITLGFLQFQLQKAAVENNPRKYARCSTMNALLSLCFGMLMLKFGFGAVGIVAGACLANVLSLYQFGSFALGQAVKQFDILIIKKMLQYGMPAAVSIVMNSLLYTIDRFFLHFMSGNTSVGLYALPFDISNQTITFTF